MPFRMEILYIKEEIAAWSNTLINASLDNKPDNSIFHAIKD